MGASVSSGSDPKLTPFAKAVWNIFQEAFKELGTEKFIKGWVLIDYVMKNHNQRLERFDEWKNPKILRNHRLAEVLKECHEKNLLKHESVREISFFI